MSKKAIYGIVAALFVVAVIAAVAFLFGQNQRLWNESYENGRNSGAASQQAAESKTAYEELRGFYAEEWHDRLTDHSMNFATNSLEKLDALDADWFGLQRELLYSDAKSVPEYHGSHEDVGKILDDLRETANSFAMCADYAQQYVYAAKSGDSAKSKECADKVTKYAGEGTQLLKEANDLTAKIGVSK